MTKVIQIMLQSKHCISLLSIFYCRDGYSVLHPMVVCLIWSKGTCTWNSTQMWFRPMTFRSCTVRSFYDLIEMLELFRTLSSAIGEKQSNEFSGLCMCAPWVRRFVVAVAWNFDRCVNLPFHTKKCPPALWHRQSYLHWLCKTGHRFKMLPVCKSDVRRSTFDVRKVPVTHRHVFKLVMKND